MYRLARAGAGLAILLSVTWAGPVVAAACQNTGSFPKWLEAFKKDALQAGISKQTLAEAAPMLRFDKSIVGRDRAQGVFSQSFAEFAGRMVSGHRIQQGGRLIKKHADLFAKVEKAYGVPAPVITAFWALESDFGVNMGKLPVFPALATLAYDCRRSQMFREQLVAALQILQDGDLSRDEMIGSWAGELGQTQFLPSFYAQYGVDFDGDGRRNLLTSTPDLIASTGNYIKGLGWQRGQPWLQEVRVPGDLDWSQADLAIQHSRAQWAEWGVAAAKGQELSRDELPASLLLPMGRNGPAFLAYPNFRIYLEWNQSLIYSTTAAYLATRLAGAQTIGKGNGKVAPLSFQQIKQLQKLLTGRGHDVGEVDGKLGAATRAAVKAEQQRLGLPADSYPTVEFLVKLAKSGAD